MEYFPRYVDIIIMVYLVGLMLSSMLYIPYRVARYKLKGTSLKLMVALCFMWPVSLPLGLLWLIVKCLIIIPIVIIFRFIVKSFTLPEVNKIPLEDERETVPFKFDPKFMNAVYEKNEKKIIQRK